MSVAPVDPRTPPLQPPPSRPGPLALVLRLALGLLALAIPLLSVWLVTSLVLATGAPLALALPLGIAVPLVLPIAWDFWAEARWRKKQNPPARILSRADRIRLRILATCLLIIGVGVFALGRTSGNALAAHGHWFLFGSQGPFAEDVRAGIRGFAGTLAGLTGQHLDAPPPEPTLARAPTPTPTPAPTPAPAPAPAPTPRSLGEAPIWPLPAEPHPVIRAMSDDDARDLDTVAERIRTHEADPYQQVKAIHDFVVRWVSYDGQALRRDYVVPPQDAASTFARKTGTCDGYVNLMLALGERLGFEMTRVLGRSRASGVKPGGFYHAWLIVTIEGRPWLVDPTWDAGGLFGLEFRPRYATSYLFTPPEIFAYDHLPDDPSLSLTEPALTESAFLERPVLSAHFFAWGLSLQGIARAVTEVETGRVDFRIMNPKGAWVLVLAQPLRPDRDEPDLDGARKPFNCVVPSQANPIEAGCVLSEGPWLLELYANDKASGSFPAVGFLKVVSR